MKVDIRQDNEIAVMTAEDHAELLAGGCDPHCHACSRVLAVGDRYSFKVFVPRATLHGLDVGKIRGTACEECTKADRGLSEEERALMFERMAAAMAASHQVVDGILSNESRRARRETVDRLAEPPPARSQRGCFVLPDGTRF